MTPLIETENLFKYFPVQRTFLSKAKKYVKAVDGVSIRVEQGKNTALVGESGSGKTTLGRLIMHFTEPTSGKIFFEGANITDITRNDLKAFRREIQMVFQDPSASLNPRKTIRQSLTQPFAIHKIGDGREREEHVHRLLESVGLHPPELYLDRYPHEISGGQKQRVVLARAVALKPKFILADEPVSALDVSIRAQVLKLMKSLAEQMRLTYLLITHDLGVVRTVCSSVYVMYLGRVVEVAETEEIFTNPLHPYTQALLASVPIPDPEVAQTIQRTPLKGDLPSPIDIPKGCRFASRCPHVFEKCIEDPPLSEVRKGHYVACWLHQ